jgi:ATP:ADP antiporter, AAA family
MFLHPNAAADVLATLLPAFFLPLVAIFRNWTYALFYTLANLWGSVVVSLLFWG